MRTIDGQFTQEKSLWRRLKRDLALLGYLARMVFSYLTEGSRVRRKYHAKEAKGEIFWVDEEIRL